MCFELITSYAPPYAFRVITVSLGTVASQYAYSSFAPWRMMPPCSCATPGRNPGTSTKVTIGMLKQSQNRMKRAALARRVDVEDPGEHRGWFATIPTGFPPRRRTRHDVVRESRCTSRKSRHRPRGDHSSMS
jgi:hypothetical protein